MGMHFIVVSVRAGDGKPWHHLYLCTAGRGLVSNTLDGTAIGCSIRMNGTKPRATIVPNSLDNDVEAHFSGGEEISKLNTRSAAIQGRR